MYLWSETVELVIIRWASMGLWIMDLGKKMKHVIRQQLLSSQTFSVPLHTGFTYITIFQSAAVNMFWITKVSHRSVLLHRLLQKHWHVKLIKLTDSIFSHNYLDMLIQMSEGTYLSIKRPNSNRHPTIINGKVKTPYTLGQSKQLFSLLVPLLTISTTFHCLIQYIIK